MRLVHRSLSKFGLPEAARRDRHGRIAARHTLSPVRKTRSRGARHAVVNDERQATPSARKGCPSSLYAIDAIQTAACEMAALAGRELSFEAWPNAGGTEELRRPVDPELGAGRVAEPAAEGASKRLEEAEKRKAKGNAAFQRGETDKQASVLKLWLPVTGF